MDFWRIFENFGFAVLVLKLPTYGLFWPLSISTLHFHQAPTTIYIKTQKSNGFPGILDTKGCQKMAFRAYTIHTPLHLGVKWRTKSVPVFLGGRRKY